MMNLSVTCVTIITSKLVIICVTTVSNVNVITCVTYISHNSSSAFILLAPKLKPTPMGGKEKKHSNLPYYIE